MFKPTPFILALFFSLSTLLAGSVTGEWDFRAKSSDGQTFYLTLSLREADGRLTGTLGNDEGELPLEKIRLNADKLIFEVTTPEGVTYTADLAIDGKKMSGTYKGDDGSSGTINAKTARK